MYNRTRLSSKTRAPSDARRVARVTRAFENVGGELSFSLALLDEHDDGLVLSSINGRADGRTYLKVVAGGTS